jgi:23S rRNA pseudouridine955/2504/2580 synthase
MQKNQVYYIEIKEDLAGQRIDNFLLAQLKGVPKTHVYRILRKGEVRVNKKRVKPSYRLFAGDQVRVPPLTMSVEKPSRKPSQSLVDLLNSRILYEDDALLVINKPAGIAVHGGSDILLGVIEALRAIHPKWTKLELVHRLDRDTSGCLMLAKKRSMLRELHALLREGKIIKKYWTLTQGHWDKPLHRVEVSLQKNKCEGGERIVYVHPEGKPSATVFKTLQVFKEATLMEALLETGRTHQIRVHAQYAGHPVAGDEKYGDRAFNKMMRLYGVKRLFLHAYSLEFFLPSQEKTIQISAPLDEELLLSLKHLNN